jgi:valyl-tRNA synthetase
MGFDDNGLPTERLVEKRLNTSAVKIGRQEFIKKCLELSQIAEQEYLALWQRLGLSIDWRYTYRTIDTESRRISQLSFLDLYRKGIAYRREAPAIWCPDCGTAIAQAELQDLDRESEFVFLDFRIDNGNSLPIATTRPELLPACVAVFVHPQDTRYNQLIGQFAKVPLFGQKVPILADNNAEQDKGTGAVICCTFGDTTDVSWWYTHKLPLAEAIDQYGRLTEIAGEYSGLSIPKARKEIKHTLEEAGYILQRTRTSQSVRVHERCDTPVEYIITRQWFIGVLNLKDDLLKAGDKIQWHPKHMKSRYRAWIENLNWDWCISRQRYFGVPFPIWYCQACDEVILADNGQLPVDPIENSPNKPCPSCGGHEFIPEEDILDTWATSSMTPQIVGRRLDQEELYNRLFPFTLRAQAHEIIRTWAFYTIVKDHFHYNAIPWSNILISGWGIAGEGMGKISKSRGSDQLAPMEMIHRYSSDAVRYWASSTSPGKDAVISEQKIRNGTKLVTKLWNVARFSQGFLLGYSPSTSLNRENITRLTPADRWILSRLEKLVRQVTSLLEDYEYASAKNEIETFFWREFTDNYLEMCKQRLYDKTHPMREGGQYTLYNTLLTLIKLFAPYLPFITEEIYQGLFADVESCQSIHISTWPSSIHIPVDIKAEDIGKVLVEIATVVRRFKSEQNLSLGTELDRLQLITDQSTIAENLRAASIDIKSITRARSIELVDQFDAGLVELPTNGTISIAINITK